jgi:chromosome segregation ATPase
MGALATREAVFKACDELLLQGHYPSARSVVAITKGSLSTVGPLRDEWWRQLAASYRDTKFLKGVPAEISDFLTGVWASACDHAAKKFDSQAAYMCQALEGSRSAHAQAAQRVSELETVVVRETDRSAQLSERVVELEAALSRLTDQHSQAIEAHRRELASLAQAHAEKLSAAEAARTEDARNHSAEVARGEDERRRLMVQLDASRQETIRLSQAWLAAAAQHETSMQAASQRLDQAAAENRELIASLSSARADAAAAASQHASSASHVAQLTAERDALNSSLRSAESLLESQAKVISGQVEASRAMGETLASFQTLLADPHPNTSPQPRSSRKK